MPPQLERIALKKKTLKTPILFCSGRYTVSPPPPPSTSTITKKNPPSLRNTNGHSNLRSSALTLKKKLPHIHSQKRFPLFTNKHIHQNFFSHPLTLSLSPLKTTQNAGQKRCFAWRRTRESTCFSEGNQCGGGSGWAEYEEYRP